MLLTSDDGASVLFTAEGVLAGNPDAFGEQAVAGDRNLYVWRQDSAHPAGQTTFVGRLPTSDIGHLQVPQATPDGRYMVFTTANQLVPTDTDTARDVYRYDADSGELTRVSTNVSGVAGNGEGIDAGISLPGEQDSHPAIADDGRKIVFTTTEALSPADENGEPDVYLWTPGRVSLITTGAVGGGADLAHDRRTPSVDGSGQDIYFNTTEALTPA